MINLITGIIGLAALLVFLGYYLVSLSFVPLAFVIIGVLGMAIGDVVLSIRKGENESGTD
ncbi:MAG: hypothetical protein R3268_06940 [Acidiferrobacterales bacterium]|nr:hypothetical protein [Acidiferrobacterales bacterium]